MLLQDGGQCNKNYARRVVCCPPKERCEVISAVAGHRMRPEGQKRILCPAPAAERQPPQCNKPAGRRATAGLSNLSASDRQRLHGGGHTPKKPAPEGTGFFVWSSFPGKPGMTRDDAWITPRDGHGVRHGRHRDGRHGHRGGHHDGHRAGGVRHHGAHRLHPGQRR